MVGAVTESVWWLYSLVLQELTLRAVFIYGTILLVSWLASKLFIFPLLSPLRKVWIFFLSFFVVFHGCPFSFQVDVCMSVILHAVWLFVFWKLYHQEMWKIMSTLSKQFFSQDSRSPCILQWCAPGSAAGDSEKRSHWPLLWVSIRNMWCIFVYNTQTSLLKTPWFNVTLFSDPSFPDYMYMYSTFSTLICFNETFLNLRNFDLRYNRGKVTDTTEKSSEKGRSYSCRRENFCEIAAFCEKEIHVSAKINNCPWQKKR